VEVVHSLVADGKMASEVRWVEYVVESYANKIIILISVKGFYNI
jgi:hypothetical protein